MTYQAWIDEAQNIVCDFVQDDDELGDLMLDQSERYWDECFYAGLTPQQALDAFISQLGGHDIDARHDDR